MVLMYCLEHVAFEFYQPYIKLLDLDILASDGSPLISGIVIAISMFGGTLGAAYSIQLNKRLGLRKLLFVAFAVQLFIIGVFSLLLSVVVFFGTGFLHFYIDIFFINTTYSV